MLDGKTSTLTELAEKENVAQRYICDLIKLTYLAPDIMDAIIAGKIPAGLTLVRLKKGFSIDWQKQRQLLKISSSPITDRKYIKAKMGGNGWIIGRRHAII